jgi:hypothetical protein
MTNKKPTETIIPQGAPEQWSCGGEEVIQTMDSLVFDFIELGKKP